MITYQWRGIEQLQQRSRKMQKAASELPKHTQDFALDVAVSWEEKAKVLAPRKSGKLSGSMRVDIAGGFPKFKLTLDSPLKYYPFVTNGTRPHLITPKSRKVLRFSAGGSIVFARSVNHPGTKPNKFDRRALEAIKPIIKARQEQLKKKIFDFS